uniref:Uncharacterized protein n=1 Tax=Sciurus vulgaris TaxID=55149 RepID=A0A8D2DAG3_SCIVU
MSFELLGFYVTFYFSFKPWENFKMKSILFPLTPRGPCLPGRLQVETQGPQGPGEPVVTARSLEPLGGCPRLCPAPVGQW